MERSLILEKRIRLLIWLIIVGLFISGATAIPLQWELNFAARILEDRTGGGAGLAGWIGHIRDGLNETYAKYPFLAYGTDWLAFGHFVIGIAFFGALRDPVRNQWLFRFGMIA